MSSRQVLTHFLALSSIVFGKILFPQGSNVIGFTRNTVLPVLIYCSKHIYYLYKDQIQPILRIILIDYGYQYWKYWVMATTSLSLLSFTVIVLKFIYVHRDEIQNTIKIQSFKIINFIVINVVLLVLLIYCKYQSNILILLMILSHIYLLKFYEITREPSLIGDLSSTTTITVLLHWLSPINRDPSPHSIRNASCWLMVINLLVPIMKIIKKFDYSMPSAVLVRVLSQNLTRISVLTWNFFSFGFESVVKINYNPQFSIMYLLQNFYPAFKKHKYLYSGVLIIVMYLVFTFIVRVLVQISTWIVLILFCDAVALFLKTRDASRAPFIYYYSLYILITECIVYQMLYKVVMGGAIVGLVRLPAAVVTQLVLEKWILKLKND